MRRYSQRPTKAPAGRIAWDAFKRAMGTEPKEISYGHGSQYGWVWTAEDARGAIWVYTASWKDAHCAYSPPIAGLLDMHRAGDAIDRAFSKQQSSHFSR